MIEEEHRRERRIAGLAATIGQYFDAIHRLREARLTLPCLSLMYSTADALATLVRPPETPEGSQKTFVDWVERYLLRDERLHCTSVELYAARCGLLHSFSSDSRASRTGRARQLAYVWGNADAKKLETAIAASPRPDKLVVINLDHFLEALEVACEQSVDHIFEDPALLEVVLERVGTFYSQHPSDAEFRVDRDLSPREPSE